MQGLDEQAINKTLDEAIYTILSQNRESQYQLGGNFMDSAEAKARGRLLIGLNEFSLEQRFPFLKDLCLKIVPPETKLDTEIQLYLQIQQALDKQGADFPLKIPHILKAVEKPELRLKGIVMERLERDLHSGSLQVLIAEAKKDRIALRMSDDLGSDIIRSFQALHALGFTHGDVNDGNVYLTNAKWREYALPKEGDRIRPSKLRLLEKADVYVLDFERAHALPRSQPTASKDQARQETTLVERMVDETRLDIGAEFELDELIEANDAYYAKRHRKTA
jgi:hypothetical protein